MDNLRFLGIKIINPDDFFELIVRLVFHLIVTFIICSIYYRKKRQRVELQKHKNYVFTFFLLSTVVFLLCFLLESVDVEMGFAVGLFAIFGILRYRTSQIAIKEMTYMFIIIGVGVINALSNKSVSHTELLLANITIIASTAFLEHKIFNNIYTKIILYEKIELIVPERRDELIADLSARTGLEISRVEINQIDFLQDTAKIRIFYIPEEEL